MKNHFRRVLFFLFISACPLIFMTTMWLFTFGQAFDFMDGIKFGPYMFATFIAILFACIVSVTIEDEDIPL